jgi:Metallo-beta-lactamase superfamily
MQFDVLPVTRYEQNCSIVWCEITRKAAVIDPGGDIPQILDFIELLEVEPEVALITHGHFDHAGGAAQFAAETGARIEGPHMGDAALLAGLTETGARFGIRATSFQPGRWLEHGDAVRFGEAQLGVLHCPGHRTPDCGHPHSKRFAGPKYEPESSLPETGIQHASRSPRVRNGPALGWRGIATAKRLLGMHWGSLLHLPRKWLKSW